MLDDSRLYFWEYPPSQAGWCKRTNSDWHIERKQFYWLVCIFRNIPKSRQYQVYLGWAQRPDPCELGPSGIWIPICSAVRGSVLAGEFHRCTAKGDFFGRDPGRNHLYYMTLYIYILYLWTDCAGRRTNAVSTHAGPALPAPRSHILDGWECNLGAVVRGDNIRQSGIFRYHFYHYHRC